MPAVRFPCVNAGLAWVIAVLNPCVALHASVYAELLLSIALLVYMFAVILPYVALLTSSTTFCCCLPGIYDCSVYPLWCSPGFYVYRILPDLSLLFSISMVELFAVALLASQYVLLLSCGVL